METVLIANKLDVGRGGSNFSLDLVARSLAARGHDTTVVTTNLTSSNAPPDDRSYELVTHERPQHDLLRPAKMAALFEQYENEADVYHVFSPLLAPYAGYYRSTGGNVPVFCRLNQYRSLCSNVAHMDGNCQEDCDVASLFRHSDESLPSRVARVPFYVLQSRKYPEWMSDADELYALTPAVGTVFEGFGVDPDAIEIIPNFYDPAFAESASSGFPTRCDRVLYVGRLSPEKGVGVLIEAIDDARVDLTLDVVGDGPERDACERLVDRRDLRDYVTFHGRVDHEAVVEHYERADVFVHPGLWPEPFTRTILEAWQTGCIVVASRVGGSPWVVDDAGLLFDRGDASDLARQLDRCARDDALVRRLAAASRERLEHFAPERVVDTVEERMEKLVQAG